MKTYNIIKNKCLTETLAHLVLGGDNRIEIQSGHNEYNCKPYPDPDLISFASSTASTISESGLAAADSLRKKIGNSPDSGVFDREFNRIREEIKSLCGITDLAGLKIVFAASGTDAHLIASRLIAPDRILMVQSSETGRGISTALSGRHFSTKSAYCTNLAQGEAVAKGTCPIFEIRLRKGNGNPRQIENIDNEVSNKVESLVQRGLRVLLVVTDVSKTGMIAPSPHVALLLKEKYPKKVDVLIDACQFRMAPPTLRTYLEKGFMVVFTGSKFLTGPAFSGALLIPKSVKHRMPPTGLFPYSSRYEWPKRLRSVHLANATNIGLLLRWEAALAEFRALKTIPEAALGDFLKQFAQMAQYLIVNNPNLECLPVPPLTRTAFTGIQCWDQIQTIFPFRILKNGQPLGVEKTRCLYDILQQDLSCFSKHPSASSRCCLGQPVACGKKDSALRFCASARLAVEGWIEPAKVMDKALKVFDKIDLILNLMDVLGVNALMLTTGQSSMTKFHQPKPSILPRNLPDSIKKLRPGKELARI